MGKKHALEHFKESGHPCAVLIGADKYVYCYECDDYVFNDTAGGDIAQLRKQMSATEAHPELVSTEPQDPHSLTRSGRRVRTSKNSRDLDRQVSFFYSVFDAPCALLVVCQRGVRPPDYSYIGGC
jgi:hypothetical protein